MLDSNTKAAIRNCSSGRRMLSRRTRTTTPIGCIDEGSSGPEPVLGPFVVEGRPDRVSLGAGRGDVLGAWPESRTYPRSSSASEHEHTNAEFLNDAALAESLGTGTPLILVNQNLTQGSLTEQQLDRFVGAGLRSGK